MNRKLTLANAIPAALATPQALDDDNTGASVRIEQDRYERRILDLEIAVRAERDRLRAEHHQILQSILTQEAAQ